MSYVVRCCRGLPDSLEMKFSIFFDLSGKLDVGVLFVKGLCKMLTGWRRMANDGWKNADDKMRISMEKWG